MTEHLNGHGSVHDFSSLCVTLDVEWTMNISMVAGMTNNHTDT